MRRILIIKGLRTALCAWLLMAACSTFGFSQTQPASQRQPFLVYDLQVKPGMGPAFENLIKNDLLPGLKKTGDSALYTAKTEFGQADSYMLVVPVKNLAQLDTPSSLAKALGEKGLAYLMLRLNELTYSPRIFMMNGRSDLGIPMQQGYEPKLEVMVKVKVAPGRQADFEKNQKAYMAAFGKTNVKGILAAQVGMGGNPDEYLSVLLFDSFADIEKFGLSLQKLLAEGKLPSPSGIVLSREITVLRNLPELSLAPAAQ